MQSRGFTLIEGLIVLVIAGVLLRLALPAMTDFVARQRAVAAINSIIGSVQLARTNAIIQSRTVTFCPRATPPTPGFELRPGCGGHADWTLGGWIFGDGNRNARIDTEEPIYGALPTMPAGATLRFRAFRNRPYLQFRPSGLTDWQNGNFLYCPPNNDARFARSIILNAQGRVRLAPDTDGDGIAEDASGRPLRCD